MTDSTSTETPTQDKQPDKPDASCKFMTNLFIAPRDRTRYIEQLRKLTQDPQIAYQRIFISIGVLALIGLITIYSLLASHPGELAYTGVSICLLCAASLMLVALYVIPSRSKSMLASVMKFAVFNTTEKARSKTSATLSSIGVKRIMKDGIIEFDNHDYGTVYAIAGVLGLASLPESIQFVAAARERHMIERDPATRETLITSVAPATFTQQKKYYASLANTPGDTVQQQWRAYMARLNQQYVADISSDSLAIKQYVILRAPSANKLRKAIHTFEQNAAAGCLAKARRLSVAATVTLLESLYLVTATSESIHAKTPQ